MRLFFRKLHRRISSAIIIRVAHWAGNAGVDRVQKTGHLLGLIHYYLVWPFNGKLRRDIARVLNVNAAEARRILRHAWALNDQAAFEIIAQGNPKFSTDALIESVTIEHSELLRPLLEQRKGSILLGMHMGNTLLAAAKLIRQGYPIRAVFREPHRLPSGYLEVCMDRIGLRPIGMDRSDPSKLAVQMLKTLQKGEMVFVLMDQGAKKNGVEVEFLNKRLLMPTGIARIAEKTGVRVFPVNTIDDQPELRFRIDEPIEIGPDRQSSVRALSKQMERHIVKFPHLWSWHHRRWKRYDLID